MKHDTKALMFQGTGSGVGKSIIVAALCRALSRRGVKVAPFKAQNMALNSFVTIDGLEMGRAQVYQAEACGLEPDVRMNPVLLKPSAEARSQVILMGRPMEHLGAVDYYRRHEIHRQVVRDAFDSLAAEYDFIVMEGAGSPAEINLQKTDIVNMAMASYAGSPVVLVGDIDRGGVFAWLKGTVDLVPRESRDLVTGFLVNKFRGDISLLQPGLEQFRAIVDLPVFGVLPWFSDIEPDQEDGVFVTAMNSQGECSEEPDRKLHIKIIKLPRISNFTDFAPFSAEDDVCMEFVEKPERLGRCNCLMIPGSKATLADLAFLRETGWSELIRKNAGRFAVVGICGGYQMLGKEIDDPYGIEGAPGRAEGLGLLPVTTVIRRAKQLLRTSAVIDMPTVTPKPVEVSGYEIHMGESRADNGGCIAMNEERGAQLGAMTESGMIWGIYLHGIFDNDMFRHDFLNFLRRLASIGEKREPVSYRRQRQAHLDRLADWLEEWSDVAEMCRHAGLHI